jgi:MoaA/NifB/PqqE/SkfB family radical SAM enzyme
MIQNIEFEWLVHYKCNYRCPYCFFDGMWETVDERNKYFPLEKWTEAWGKIAKSYKNVRLLITGGEPFCYPCFLELLKVLSKRISVGFDTNLSCSKKILIDFINNVDITNVSLGLSFHPLFADFDVFLEKALFLKKNGVSNICIQYVTYPPQLEKMKYFKKRFLENGLYFIPLPFRGSYNGNEYPSAHTEEEMKIVYDSTMDLSTEHKERVKKHLIQVRSKDRLCKAGQSYARVDNDGTVYRCARYAMNSDNGKIGNLFDSKFKLYDKPYSCTQEICPCEFRWII